MWSVSRGWICFRRLRGFKGGEKNGFCRNRGRLRVKLYSDREIRLRRRIVTEQMRSDLSMKRYGFVRNRCGSQPRGCGEPQECATAHCLHFSAGCSRGDVLWVERDLSQHTVFFPWSIASWTENKGMWVRTVGVGCNNNWKWNKS